MSIAARIAQIETLIKTTAKDCQRKAESIQLVAVSKAQSSAAIREAYAAGLRQFGENYLQEALPKIENLKDLAINWHFIGPIQSNKTKGIAQHFSWVHSVSREEIAKNLAIHRPKGLGPLNVCLQVNLDHELTKSGIFVDQLAELAKAVNQMPALRLRGLMTICKPLAEEQGQYESFLRLTRLFNELNNELKLSMDTLSMGMSNDIVAAIRAGSTMLRIGTAIFGERATKFNKV